MNKTVQSRLIPMLVSLEFMARPFPETDYTGAKFGRGKECFNYVKFNISIRHLISDGKKAIRSTHLYQLRVLDWK